MTSVEVGPVDMDVAAWAIGSFASYGSALLLRKK